MILPPILKKLGISIRDLLTPQSVPQKSGVRSLVARGMGGRNQKWTPAAIASALSAANQGRDIATYLDLAADMEVADLHYRAVLSTRKLAVTGMDLIVEAADDTPEAVADADLTREVLRNPAIQLAYKDVLDALGKGFSVCEIAWETSESDWRPVGLSYCDPRWYSFDESDRKTVMLWATYSQRTPLKPYGYVVHVPSIISSIPIRRGLAWPAAWAWCIKNFAVQDWSRFSEAYGMPLRVGKYPGGTPDEQIKILLDALKNLGSDLAAAIPQDMIIEFIERSGGEKVIFEGLAEWVDRQVAMAILGQYGTVQSTAGQLGNAGDKQRVRSDIRDDDAIDLAATLRRDIVKPLIDLNFGERLEYPYLRFLPQEDADIVKVGDFLAKLVPLGLGIEKSWARDLIGAPDPEPGAELLGAPMPQPGAGPTLQSQHAAKFRADSSYIDPQIDRLAQAADAAQFVLIDQVRGLLEKSATLPEFQRELLLLYPDLDAKGLATAMTDAMVSAHLAGRFELMRNV